MPDQKRPISTASGSLPYRSHGGAILVVVIGLVILSVALAARQSERTEERSERPAQRRAMSVVTLPAASTAVPAGDPAFVEGSLPALLGLVPDQIDDDTNGLPIEATFADIEGWLAHLAVDAAEHPAAALKAQLQVLELSEVLVSRGLSTEWRDVYGFDLHQVDQVLAVGDAPNQILIMPGRYDVDALYETWVRSGYQAVEVEEQTVWSLFPGDQIDLSAPARRPALGMLNNVILLDSGTLIASGRILHHGGGAGANPATLASPAAGATPSVVDTLLPEVELVLFEWLPVQDSHDTASITMTMLYDDAPEDFASLPSLLQQRVQEDDAWSSQ